MKRFYLLVIVMILSAACAPSAPDVKLHGAWGLVAYGDAANPTPALPGVDTLLEFKAGQLNGNVGCNGFGGDYTLKGNSITVGPIMSTMMYCEQTMAQEQGVLAVLQGTLTMELEGDLLTLTTEAGQVVILTPSGL